MHLVTKLNNILQSLVNDGFISERIYTYSAQFNVIAGRCRVPVGVLLLPNRWKLECDTVTAREHGVFDIYFLTTQPQLDFDATSNEVLIDNMIDVATEFIGRVKSDKSIHINEIDINLQSIYDANNKNLTGVHIAIDLKEQQGRCIPTYGGCL